MKFLIDTNVFIPLEPTTSEDVSALTPSAAEFIRLTQQEHFIYYHPIIEKDFDSDKNKTRRDTRKSLLKKYHPLPAAPEISPRIINVLGPVNPDTHDWVDHHLLATIERDAVDFIVTEDKGIHRKGKRLGLADRILLVNDAVAYLAALQPIAPPDYGEVVELPAHAIYEGDPIFDSFREDYPEFDQWLSKIKREHRPCYVINRKLQGSDRLAAIGILKDESTTDFGLRGRTLKICSFKVSEDFSGSKLGELLLNRILRLARDKQHKDVYVTILPSHPDLITFMQEFGFVDRDHTTNLGEKVLSKSLLPDEDIELSPLDYHIRYGPGSEKFTDCQMHVIPIQPNFHELLFPGIAGQQPELFPQAKPFGNAIRKVYLCHSPSRRINPGDLLLFYRSQDMKAITGIGVAEKTLVSSDPNQIARFAGLRTVYSLAEIKEMCKKDVLSILFRYSRPLANPLHIQQLVDAHVLQRAPQSITLLLREPFEWIQKQIA